MKEDPINWANVLVTILLAIVFISATLFVSYNISRFNQRVEALEKKCK